MKKHEPMTEERLLAIKMREAEATPGPWRVKCEILDIDKYGNATAKMTHVSANDNAICFIYGRGHDDVDEREDAAFIAHAREDVPALLAEVESLRKQLDGLKKIAAFSMGCTSHPQWEKKYKLQWGMEIFEKIGIDNVIKNFHKFYRELPF